MEIKILESNESENMTTQNLWDAVKTVLREIYSNAILPQETRKTLKRQPNFTRKTGKRRTKNLEISRRKEITMI